MPKRKTKTPTKRKTGQHQNEPRAQRQKTPRPRNWKGQFKSWDEDEEEEERDRRFGKRYTKRHGRGAALAIQQNIGHRRPRTDAGLRTHHHSDTYGDYWLPPKSTQRKGQSR